GRSYCCVCRSSGARHGAPGPRAGGITTRGRRGRGARTSAPCHWHAPFFLVRRRCFARLFVFPSSFREIHMDIVLRRPLKKAVFGAAMAAALLGLTGTAVAAPPPSDYNSGDVLSSQAIAAATVDPCDPAGPTAQDQAIANATNPLLTNKMRGNLTAYN